jgi:signal peptidase I
VAWFAASVVGVGLALWLAASPRVAGIHHALWTIACLFVLHIAMLVHAYLGVRQPENRAENKPWFAAFLSGILPGIGQFYSGQVFAGLLAVAATVFLATAPAAAQLFGGQLIGLVASLHAYRAARLQTGAAKNRIWLLTTALVAELLLLGGGILVVRTFFVQPFKVPTNTMAPTIRGITKLADGRIVAGDHIFVDKLSYRFRSPRRGDVVVFRTDDIAGLPEASRGEYYVKRIVGLPGERVSIHPPFVYINGKKLTEPPIFQAISSRQSG